MAKFLKSLTPQARILLAYGLGGIVLVLFLTTLVGFLYVRTSMQRLDRYNQSIQLARETDTNFQLAISKGKNFAILKDDLNKTRMQSYYQKAKENFSELSALETDPQGKELIYKLGAGIKNVEFPLGILTSTAKRSDPPEKLYKKFLKDITIDFDNASQGYVDYLNGNIQKTQSELNSRINFDLCFALAGVLLALLAVATSFSIARNLNQALKSEMSSQERFRMLADVTEEAILIHDQGVVVDANLALSQMLGYEPSEMIGKHVSQFQDPSATQKMGDYIQKGYPEGSYEITALRKDGTTFPLLVHGRDIDYKGRKMRLSCGRDLTEWKKAEQALQESEERFRHFAEVSKEGILIHEEGTIVDVNPTLTQMTGYTAAEFAGRDTLFFMGGESIELVKKFRREGYPTGSYEITARRKDGTEFPAEAHGRYFQFGGKKLRVVSVWDITERKKAQEELRNREQYYRALIENVQDVITVVDFNGAQLFASPAQQKTIGYSPEELQGKGFQDFIHPDDLPAVMEVFGSIIKEPGRVNRVKYRFRHKDGHWVVVDSIGKAFKSGGTECVIIANRDVTDQEKAEEALRLSEKNFRTLIEQAPDGVLVNQGGKTVYVNRKCLELLGYPEKEELLLKDPLEVVHPEAREKVLQRIQRNLRGEANQPAEMKVLRKDGSAVEVETSSIGIQFQGQPASMVILRDITERKKAEQALAESEERFRKFAEVTKEGIFIHDNGVIVDANKALADMTGYTVAEMIGRKDLFLGSEEAAAQLERYRREGFPLAPYEMLAGRKDGTVFPAEIHGRSFDFKGKKLRVVSMWDITERKKAEEALRASEEKFRSVIENSNDIISIADRNGVVQYMSPSVKRILGYDPSERIGQRFGPIMHPDDVERMKVEFSKLLENKDAPITVRFQLKHRDGSWRHFESTGINLLDHPVVQGLVYNMHDITVVKLAEEELRRQERYFRSLIEKSYEAFVIVGPDMLVRYTSPAMKEIYGWDPDDRIGRDALELIHPEDMDRAKEYTRSLLGKPGGAETVQLRFRHKNGHYLVIEARGTNLIGDLDVGGIVINYRNVTERVEAEEALRASEEKFRNLIENSHDVVSISGKDAGMSYISPSIKRVLGYEPEERIGKGYLQIMHPEDDERIRGEFSKLLQSPGASWTVQFRLKHKDGSWKNVESTGTNLLENPAVQGVVYNLRDVTERVQAEEGLRQSEENFRNLIEKSPDAMMVHTHTQTVYVNDAMLRLLGYARPEELVGKDPDMVVHPDDRAAVKTRIRRLEEGQPYTSPVERKFLTKDGRVVPVEVVRFTIRFQGQEMVVAIARDLTERKETEKALMKFERLSTIGEMAAGMAHEIRNPLAAISTAAQLLKRKEKKKEEVSFADTILEQSHRLNRLVEDTLDYARAEKTIPRESFSLKPVLESALHLSQVQFGPSHSRIQVKWELPDKGLEIYANPQRITQILVNLILNAYQSMGAEGNLTLGFKTEGRWALIGVADTGAGIREEDINRVFEPFYTTKKGGSGLGLALSQRIAQEYGGKITVERLKPHGTAFTLHLPTSEKGTA